VRVPYGEQQQQWHWLVLPHCWLPAEGGGGQAGYVRVPYMEQQQQQQQQQ
jgi:hypothetical protein